MRRRVIPLGAYIIATEPLSPERVKQAMPTPRVPDDPGEREQAIAEFTANYPAIMRMATLASHAGAGCDDDAEFAFALDLILAGVHQLHQGGWR